MVVFYENDGNHNYHVVEVQNSSLQSQQSLQSLELFVSRLGIVMLSLCRPYSPSIVCLCSETGAAVHCFLTRPGTALCYSNNKYNYICTYSKRKRSLRVGIS